ncbi:trypsin-like peptidase domain-containing protein [Phytoactinopolyspora limicola]|uniref:trypsin-like peptidase domain-containing protein n=1 Tax=Phytoactinopolyspora limicola TaxID=2715536 RepID=UPI001407BD50|nr:trypsin-like peptidase domain-containing protein [Phytoactinopolyspora limicola]
MFCSRCGSRLGADVNYCPACGHPAANVTVPPSAGRRFRLAIIAGVTVLGLGGAAAVTYALLRDDASDPPTVAAEPTVPDGSPIPSPMEATEPATTDTTGPTPPPPAADFADLYRTVSSGVLMVQATTCEGSGVGSAFLISGHQIVTAAHVVDQAASVAVIAGGHTHQATVVGLDGANDIAILETPSELDGHRFTLTEADVAAGESLAVIGHPLGDPLTMTTGTVSRVDDALWPNIQLDISVSPGNSGGPVLRPTGEVVGVLIAKDVEAEGLSYAVRSDLVVDRLTRPDLLSPPEIADCELPLGPDDAELPEIEDVSELHLAVAQTLDRYFGGINSGDYQLAFDQLSPRLQGSMTAADFAAGVETSYDFGFEVHWIEETPQGAEIWLEFTSIQAPGYGPEGESCTHWSLDYELAWYGEWLLIDRVTGHGGTSGHLPCD